MSRIENRVSRGGSVRAVFSQRCKGYAAPLDLIIAHLKAAVLWRELWRAQRQNEAMRARIAQDFGGYLVTEPDQDDAELRKLESMAHYAKKYAEKAPPFSERRGLYKPGMDSLCMTGAAGVPWSEIRRGFSAPIDAPICMPAGACVNMEPFWFPGDDATQLVVVREPWQ